MATLAGATIASTFKSLLKLAGNTDDLVAASGGAGKQVMTGDGEGTPIYLNTDRIGFGVASPGSVFEFQSDTADGTICCLIDNNDPEGYALAIQAANTIADVFYIAAGSVTNAKVINIQAAGLTTGTLINTVSTHTLADTNTSHAISLAMTNDSVNNQTAHGIVLDYNKTGITASGDTANVAGMQIDMDDSATNVGICTQTALQLYSNFSNAGGTVSAIGLSVDVGGADTNYAALFSGGYVGIGLAAPTHALHILEATSGKFCAQLQHSHATEPAGLYINFSGYTADTADDDFYLQCVNGDGSPATVCRIDGNGTVENTTGLCQGISDKRLKENIADFTGGLAIVNALEPKTYTWKSKAARGMSGTQYGFMAQDVLAVSGVTENMRIALVSNAFGENHPDYEQFKDYIDDEKVYKSTLSGREAVLISAIKELSAKVTALENA